MTVEEATMVLVLLFWSTYWAERLYLWSKGRIQDPGVPGTPPKVP